MYHRFHQIAEAQPDRIAVADEKQQLTFAELERLIQHLRPRFTPAALKSRQPQPIVLAVLPNGPLLTAVLLACLAEKTAIAAIPAQTTPHEARHYLDVLHPDLVVVASPAAAGGLVAQLPPQTAVMHFDRHGAAPHHPGMVTTAGDLNGHRSLASSTPTLTTCLPPDTAWIQFTSGSTARPKGILLGRSNLQAYMRLNASHLKRWHKAAVFCPMPQFHAFGGVVALEHLLHGATVLLVNGFFPGQDLARMQKARCRLIASAPHYLKLMLALGALSPETLPSLEAVLVGTAAVDRQLVRDLRTGFADLTIIVRYGLTETVGAITRLIIGPGKQLEAPGLVGPAAPGVELGADLPPLTAELPGEISVRGPIVATGELIDRNHWRPLTTADGFLATGDMGFQDPAGNVHLRGRSSGFIKSQGYRVSPFEIEEALRTLPAVQEAVVVGVPDAMAGEKIAAWVEIQTGGEDVDHQELTAACRRLLAPHKVPQRFMLCRHLLRSPAGKPDRAALRDKAIAGEGLTPR